jgi:uncharacterized membrane protein YjgN (DUF898 family)
MIEQPPPQPPLTAGESNAPPAAQGPGVPPPASHPLVHAGRTAELLAISLVNLLLKVVTVGVYHFWAKTRVRRYVWSHTYFAGEAFEYTGRGLELLLGYGVAMLVIVPLVAGLNGLQLWAETHPFLVLGVSLAAYPVFVFLTGFATFSAYRYLLSRTRWRSIRFALTGRARDHGARLLLYGLLTTVTFGLYLPFLRNRMLHHLVNHARFGSERFRYDGPDDVLLRRYLLCGALMVGVLVLVSAVMVGIGFLVLPYARELEPESLAALAPVAVVVATIVLLLPGMAVPWLWYKGGELRHFVAHTRLGEARFALELPTGRYLWLALSSYAALLFTLGLAYPWVVVRTARAIARHLRMEGHLDLEAIQQSAALAPRVGEGLADAFDLGAI